MEEDLRSTTVPDDPVQRRDLILEVGKSATIEVKMEIRVRPDAEGAPRAEVKSAARRKPARKGKR